jgi:hypothetical protein
MLRKKEEYSLEINKKSKIVILLSHLFRIASASNNLKLKVWNIKEKIQIMLSGLYRIASESDYMKLKVWNIKEKIQELSIEYLNKARVFHLKVIFA